MLELKSFTAFAALLCLLVHPSQDDLEASISRGEELYMEYCIQCHLPDGTGTEGVHPPIAGSDYLMNNPEGAIKAVKYGQQGQITVNGVDYNSYMPAPGFEDAEIADVMNFILHRLGNESELVVTEEMVTAIEQ